jgi:predicted AlkP superfamily pyrophosphatase or phosphodiesterase
MSMRALAGALILAAAAHAAALPGVEHVVVVGFDGLSPRGIQAARTPHFDAVRRVGAFTWHARGVMPTSSSPNWASMIMGAGPEQHGVTSNDWMPDQFDIAPVVTGPGGIFPTIFGVLRGQQPRAVIGVFHDWEGFGRLVEKGVPDAVEHHKGAENTMRRAIEFAVRRRPRLLFIHLDHVDHAGHKFGHGSPEYIAAVELADALTGQLLEALDQAGMRTHTILLLTADHGGVGRKHGGATMAEIEIPWIIAGPGVAAGRELRKPVNTYDTAPTLAHVLGLTPPDAWIGRPVLEAFGSK